MCLNCLTSMATRVAMCAGYPDIRREEIDWQKTWKAITEMPLVQNLIGDHVFEISIPDTAVHAVTTHAQYIDKEIPCDNYTGMNTISMYSVVVGVYRKEGQMWRNIATFKNLQEKIEDNFDEEQRNCIIAISPHESHSLQRHIAAALTLAMPKAAETSTNYYMQRFNECMKEKG